MYSQEYSKTILMPVLTCGDETWALPKEEFRILSSFERKILQLILGAIRDDREFRGGYNSRELYEIYGVPDVIGVINPNRVRGLEGLQRMPESRVPKSRPALFVAEKYRKKIRQGKD